MDPNMVLLSINVLQPKLKQQNYSPAELICFTPRMNNKPLGNIQILKSYLVIAIMNNLSFIFNIHKQ